jgi:type I restriction enzyme S subunit
MGRIKKLSIPIPPLPIQEEIVKILDNFTTLTAELQAELQARKTQYEYYRNALLDYKRDEFPCTPDNSVAHDNSPLKDSTEIRQNHEDLHTSTDCKSAIRVEWKTLEELFEIKNGYTPSTHNKNFWNNGTIPWFRMEDLRENGRILSDSIQHVTKEAVKGGKLFPANSIIVATTATIGEHALIIADSLANQQFTFLSKRKSLALLVNMKYIYYYMFRIDDWCKNHIHKGGFASVDMVGFKKLLIPIPPLSEQERIVAILDKFDALINDISIGLPLKLLLSKKNMSIIEINCLHLSKWKQYRYYETAKRRD